MSKGTETSVRMSRLRGKKPCSDMTEVFIWNSVTKTSRGDRLELNRRDSVRLFLNIQIVGMSVKNVQIFL